MTKMFDHSGYKQKKPTLERARERQVDRGELQYLGQQAIEDNSDYFQNNPGAQEFFSTSKEHGPGIDYVNEFLGGKSKRKTHKRKYKSKKKNISRKRKQSRRKGKKTNKK